MTAVGRSGRRGANSPNDKAWLFFRTLRVFFQMGWDGMGPVLQYGCAMVHDGWLVDWQALEICRPWVGMA